MQLSENLILFQFSPLNIDRFVSLLKACNHEKRTMIIDSYAVHVLDCISKERKPDGKGRAKIQSWSDRLFKIYFSSAHKNVPNYLQKQFSQNELLDNSDLKKSVMLVRASMMNEKKFKSLNIQNTKLIYSQYSGYRETQESQKDFEKFLDSKNVTIKNIHTSGHIVFNDLKLLLEKMKPNLYCPIHSASRNTAYEIYPANKIKIVDNFIPFSI